MYGAGLILLFMLTKTLPKDHNIKENYNYNLPSFYSEDFQKQMTSVLTLLLNHNADLRPSASEVLELPCMIKPERNHLRRLLRDKNNLIKNWKEEKEHVGNNSRQF